MDQIQAIKQVYDISDLGFLPAEPLPSLTTIHPDFQSWENIIKNIATLNSQKLTREKIMSCPDFPLDKLLIPWHFKKAYCVLSFLKNAYLFSDTLVNILPIKIANPLKAVAAKVEIVPAMTYASVDLFNWEIKDKSQPFILDNLKSTYLYTGTRDEEWFFLIMIKIEEIGGKIIHDMLTFYVEQQKGTLNEKHLLSLLENIFTRTEEISTVASQTYKHCKPDTFFHGFRKYLSGSKGNDALPQGIFFEEETQSRQYYGGSAAQSSLIQILDKMFGVTHSSPYFIEIRQYMPGPHRKFIEFVENNINIMHYINNINNESKNELLNMANKCIVSIKKFRNVHFTLAKKYIIKYVGEDAAGTGGTKLVDFLNTAINETK